MVSTVYVAARKVGQPRVGLAAPMRVHACAVEDTQPV